MTGKLGRAWVGAWVVHGVVHGVVVHGVVVHGFGAWDWCMGLVRLDLGVGSCLDGEGEELVGGV